MPSSLSSRPLLRTAFLTDAPRVAGSEVWLLEVLPRLRASGIEPEVYLPRHAALDDWAAALAAAGVAQTRYAHLHDLPALTCEADVRVVQAWDPATYAGLWPQLASPRLVLIHDQLDYHYPLGLKAWYRTVYRQTKGRQLRGADGLVTVSAWGERFLSGTLGLPVAGHVLNGVDTDKYRPAEAAERAALRSGLGWSRFTVLVPGRFALEKNQLAALAAARQVPEVDFVFVGDMDSPIGTLAQAMQRRWGLSNVRFLGRRWDMPQLYRAADVLLQPTLAENQSLVTLEAMACGLPILTTPIPAQAELIESGVQGLLVPPQPHLMALALRRMAAHPEQVRRWGQAARARVLERHTVDQTARRFADLLRGQLPGQ